MIIGPFFLISKSNVIEVSIDAFNNLESMSIMNPLGFVVKFPQVSSDRIIE